MVGRGEGERVSFIRASGPEYVPAGGVKLSEESHMEIFTSRLLSRVSLRGEDEKAALPFVSHDNIEEIASRPSVAIFYTPSREFWTTYSAFNTKRGFLSRKEKKVGRIQTWELYRGRDMDEAIQAAQTAIQESPENQVVGEFSSTLDKESVMQSLEEEEARRSAT